MNKSLTEFLVEIKAPSDLEAKLDSSGATDADDLLDLDADDLDRLGLPMLVPLIPQSQS